MSLRRVYGRPFEWRDTKVFFSSIQIPESSNEEVKKGFRGFELRSFAERRSIMENLLDLCIRWKVICLLEDWKKMLVCKENGEIMPGERERERENKRIG